MTIPEVKGLPRRQTKDRTNGTSGSNGTNGEDGGLRGQRSEVRGQMSVLSAQCSVLSVQCSVFSVQCSEFGVRSSEFGVRCPVSGVRRPAFGARCSASPSPIRGSLKKRGSTPSPKELMGVFSTPFSGRHDHTSGTSQVPLGAVSSEKAAFPKQAVTCQSHGLENAGSSRRPRLARWRKKFESGYKPEVPHPSWRLSQAFSDCR